VKDRTIFWNSLFLKAPLRTGVKVVSRPDEADDGVGIGWLFVQKLHFFEKVKLDQG
jgi:hypothetical protein